MRPRYKDYLELVWCAIFDTLALPQTLYRGDKRGPGVWVGEKAQLLWYRAHNNRAYNWLSGDDDPRRVRDIRACSLEVDHTGHEWTGDDGGHYCKGAYDEA